jgi:hypothetical protein
MAETSTVHKFIDKTISVADTAEQKFTERTAVVFWAVYNHSTVDTLYVKTNTDNDSLNAIPVAPESYKIVGALPFAAAGYDLSDYRFVSAKTAAHRFTIEYIKA